MRATDLIGSRVVDASGRDLGPLRDLRVGSVAVDGALPLLHLVIGGRHLAHLFGYVDSRTTGPALIKNLLRRGGRDSAVVVPASAVTDWTPPILRLGQDAEQVAIPIEEAW